MWFEGLRSFSRNSDIDLTMFTTQAQFLFYLANGCLSSLAGSLKSYFTVHCLAIVSFVNKQFVESPLTCITHMMSVISLIRQVDQ